MSEMIITIIILLCLFVLLRCLIEEKCMKRSMQFKKERMQIEKDVPIISKERIESRYYLNIQDIEGFKIDKKRMRRLYQKKRIENISENYKKKDNYEK